MKNKAFFLTLVLFAGTFTFAHAQAARVAANLLKQATAKGAPMVKNALLKAGVSLSHTKMPTVSPAAQRIALPSTTTFAQRTALQSRWATSQVPKPVTVNKIVPIKTYSSLRVSPEAKQIGIKAVKGVAKGYMKQEREKEQARKRQGSRR